MKPSTKWILIGLSGAAVAIGAYIRDHNLAPIPCPPGTVTDDRANPNSRFGFDRYCTPRAQ